MKPIIVVADDSLTIQKVIKITLSQEDYSTFECLKSADLTASIKEHKPSLVLLDFNLSDDKTGYDLAREIKSITPSTKILMLYGTFDTINKDLLQDAGADAHIVKPFDGTKFISKCANLLSDSVVEEIKEPDPIVDETDDWTVSQPAINEDEDEDEEAELPPIESTVEDNLSDWGMSIPSVIGVDDSAPLELPPIISADSSDDEEGEEIILPEYNDLEYPGEVEKKAMLNLDEWKVEVPVLDESDEVLTASDEDFKKLQSEIEQDSDNDLWAVDEVIEESEPAQPLKIHVVKDVPSKSPPADFPSDVMDEQVNDSAKFNSISQTQVEDSIDKLLPEMIERIIREKVDHAIERAIDKIAWEVIPDLAENLIKKELRSISENLIED